MQFDPPKRPFDRQRPDSDASNSMLLPGPYSSGSGVISPFSSPSRSLDTSPAPFEAPGLHTAESNLSLSVNYVPSKFSNPAGPRRRNTKSVRVKDPLNPSPGLVPKMGGGVDAFRSGEARIGGPIDDEEEDDESGPETNTKWFGRRGSKHPPRKLRWNRFKWVLFVANLALTLYSFATLILCLLTWFNIWEHADVIRVANRPELVLSTLAAGSGIFVSLIGWGGLLTNNRSFLALYTFLLWVVFIFILIPGYMTYKRRTFNLEGKVNAQWSKGLGEAGRLRVQNELQCCGYFSPFVEATVSQFCYARSILPGCKARYLVFERHVLKTWYTVAFGLVPFHLAVMIAGLLCSNHVTYRFGKGMMPKAYRLSVTSMAIIMDNYAGQLAEQYGQDIATDVLARSRSNLNLQLEAMPTVPYAPSSSGHGHSHGHTDAGGANPSARSHGGHGVRYDKLSTKPPPPDSEGTGLM